MAAKLEWVNGSLCLGGLAFYINIVENDGRWEAYGDASFGEILCKSWEKEDDARQGVLTEVRRLLKEAGVEVEP